MNLRGVLQVEQSALRLSLQSPKTATMLHTAVAPVMQRTLRLSDRFAQPAEVPNHVDHSLHHMKGSE